VIKKTKNFLENFLLKYKTKDKEDVLPTHLSIEITNSCNFRCKMCPSSEQDFYKGTMSWQTLEKLIFRVKEVKTISLITIGGMGEPTLDKELPQKIALLRNELGEDVVIQIHTNGSSSTKLLEKMFPYVSVFSVSINSATAKGHETITGTTTYHQVLRNINHLARFKPKYHYKIRLTFVDSNLLPENEKKAFKECFKSFSDKLVIHEDKSWGSWKGKKPEVQRPCTVIWKTLSINWDGTVRLCTEDFNRQYLLGDIAKSSIEEIFNSKLIVKAREEHQKGSFGKNIKICKNCSKTKSNIFRPGTLVRHRYHKNYLDTIFSFFSS